MHGIHDPAVATTRNRVDAEHDATERRFDQRLDEHRDRTVERAGALAGGEHLLDRGDERIEAADPDDRIELTGHRRRASCPRRPTSCARRDRCGPPPARSKASRTAGCRAMSAPASTASENAVVRTTPGNVAMPRFAARASAAALPPVSAGSTAAGSRRSTTNGFIRSSPPHAGARASVLLVSMAGDVDDVPVRGAHEEPADAPRFVGQRVNDLVTEALRFRVSRVDVVPGVHRDH